MTRAPNTKDLSIFQVVLSLIIALLHPEFLSLALSERLFHCFVLLLHVLVI